MNKALKFRYGSLSEQYSRSCQNLESVYSWSQGPVIVLETVDQNPFSPTDS
jgi:hypothetical protein